MNCSNNIYLDIHWQMIIHLPVNCCNNIYLDIHWQMIIHLPVNCSNNIYLDIHWQMIIHLPVNCSNNIYLDMHWQIIKHFTGKCHNNIFNLDFNQQVRRLTCGWSQVFPITVISPWTWLALVLLVQPTDIAVCSSRTGSPVQTSTSWTIVAGWTDDVLTFSLAVITSWTQVASCRMCVIYLEKMLTNILYRSTKYFYMNRTKDIGKFKYYKVKHT